MVDNYFFKRGSFNFWPFNTISSLNLSLMLLVQRESFGLLVSIWIFVHFIFNLTFKILETQCLSTFD